MTKHLVALPVLALAFFAAPNTAHAGNCGSITSVTSDLWAKYGSYVEQNIPYADTVKKMISYWNQMAGGSWAKIGPRRLEYGKALAGTVVGPTDRVFIAETPSDKAAVEFTIKKLDGKAKTSVTVCKTGKDGKPVKVWDFTATNGNYTKTWKKTITKTKGQILSVHLHGFSATNKFKYTVSAKKK